jgi:putative SOS response-associated peptidase YedK
MCKRYSFFSSLEIFANNNSLSISPLMDWQPNYNASATHVMPVINNEFPKAIQFIRWGLVPQWAKDIRMGANMVNSLLESIQEKPAVTNIFKYKRCIVPADGYYEWVAQSGTKEKQPMRFHLPNNQLMFFAGLWDVWGDGLYTFSIITQPAQGKAKLFDDRMPAILSPKDAWQWLNNVEAPNKKLKLIKPENNDALLHYNISHALNNTDYNQPDIILPAIL